MKLYLKLKPILFRLLNFLPVVVIIVCFSLLRSQYESISWIEIKNSIYQRSRLEICWAYFLTLTSFLLLGISEYNNAKKFSQKLRFTQAFFMSWTSTAVSNYFNLAGLSGASLRSRFLKRWGLEDHQILKFIFSNSLFIWSGFLLALSLVSGVIQTSSHLGPYLSTQTLTTIKVFVPAFSVLIFLLIFKFKDSSALEKIGLRHHSHKSLAFQFSLNTLDWLFSAMVLYFLLPSQMPLSMVEYLLVFFVGQFGGLLFNVPAGLGVLDALLLSVSSDPWSKQVMASLVLYRLIYYMNPLLFSLVALAFAELKEKSPLFFESLRALVKSFENVMIKVLVMGLLVSGLTLVLSRPENFNPYDLIWLTALIPVQLIRSEPLIFHLLGVFMVFLSLGIAKRSNLAWYLSIVAVGAGLIMSVLMEYEIPVVGALIFQFLLLWASRDSFSRQAFLFSGFFSRSWLFFLSLFSLGFCGLAITILHLGSNDYWWDVQSIWSAMVVSEFVLSSFIIITMVGLSGLIFPKKTKPLQESAFSFKDNEAEIAKISNSAPFTYSQLAFLGDKKFLLSEDKCSFVMYKDMGDSLIAMGDPVSPSAEAPRDLVKSLIQKAEVAGRHCVFYQVRPENLSCYYDLGLKIIKVGEEAIVKLKEFSLEGRSMKPFRNACNRVEKQHVEFKIVAPSELSAYMEQIKNISDRWLQKNGGQEKGFSLGFYDQNYLARYSHGLLLQNGKVVAFANIWETKNKTELSVDLMRFDPDGPSGSMDYLMIQLLLWGKTNGYQNFNLGMAPLSGLEGTLAYPVWKTVASFLFENGDRFYNFQGVRSYKEKFCPEWSSRYVAYSSQLALTSILIDVVRAISTPPKEEAA